MEQIKSFYKTRLHNEEDLNFDILVLNEIDKSTDALFKNRFNDFRSVVLKYAAIMKRIMKSAETQAVNDTDEIRDRACTGTFLYTEAMTYHSSPDKAESARRIKIVLDTYRNPSRFSLGEQSGVIYNILEELSKPSYATHIQKIALSEWLAYVSTAQRNFEAAYAKRADSRSEEATDTTTIQARKDADVEYNKAMATINALLILQPTTELTKIVGRINDYIDSQAALIAQRKGRNAAKKEKEEQEAREAQEATEGGAE